MVSAPAVKGSGLVMKKAASDQWKRISVPGVKESALEVKKLVFVVQESAPVVKKSVSQYRNRSLECRNRRL